MIVGQEKPDGGTLRVGETVKLAYVDQSRDALERRQDACGTRSAEGEDDGRSSASERSPSRAYCRWFNFKGSDQQKLVKDLSGGERNRVHLAKLLKSGGNLLLLDEPTNDLDVETLRVARRRAARVPRLRGRHQPRSLVPRPHRDAHPRVRRRQPGRVVRRQLPGLRSGPEARASAPTADQPHRIKYRKL